MGVGYLHMAEGSVRYHVAFEQVGGHQVWVATLADDPTMRALGAREETAIATLRERLEAAVAPDLGSAGVVRAPSSSCRVSRSIARSRR
jgi:hypothetical protein